jgi:hypothetical protein
VNPQLQESDDECQLIIEEIQMENFDRQDLLEEVARIGRDLSKKHGLKLPRIKIERYSMPDEVFHRLVFSVPSNLEVISKLNFELTGIIANDENLSKNTIGFMPVFTLD